MESTAAHFLDLPDEVIASLCAFLTPTDIHRLSQTCRKLYAICSHDSGVWKTQCYQLWPREDIDAFGAYSFRQRFVVLHRYSRLFGLWREANSFRGGLICIHAHENQVHCKYITGSAIEDQVLPALRFDLDPEALVLSLRYNPSFNGIDPSASPVLSESIVGGQLMHELKGRPNLRTDKRAPPIRERYLWEQYQYLQEQRRTERAVADHPEISHVPDPSRFSTGRFTFPQDCQLDLETDHLRKFVRLPRSDPDCLLEGLWSASYGSHGSELIYVFRAGGMVHGKKILGDINVPAGEISFQITTFHNVADEFASGVFPVAFNGRAHIAMVGFLHEDWDQSVIILNSENSFTVFWLRLRSSITFTRYVADPALQRHFALSPRLDVDETLGDEQDDADRSILLSSRNYATNHSVATSVIYAGDADEEL